MDGHFAAMMHKICVALPDLEKVEQSNRLLDHKKKHKNPFGMVQIVVYRLLSLRSLGAKLLFEKHFLLHPPDIFSTHEEQDFEVMTRTRMPVTGACAYHVDNVASGESHAITAHMMYECVVHQVMVIGGDANKVAYQTGQQLNASYSTKTFQVWLDRMESALEFT